MDNPKAWSHFLKNEWGKSWEGPGGQGQFGGSMGEQYPGHDEFTGDPLPRGKRKADKHTLRRIDLRDMMEKEQPKEEISIEHFSSRRAAGEWNKNPDKGFDKSWPQDDGGWDIPKKKKKNKDFDGPDDPMLGFNSLSTDGPRPKGPSPRYYAELFDITKEGETAKGKGKSNTPMMRKNPKKWTEHKQNGQFTKRWN
jgi:hypothetical protein